MRQVEVVVAIVLGVNMRRVQVDEDGSTVVQRQPDLGQTDDLPAEPIASKAQMTYLFAQL